MTCPRCGAEMKPLFWGFYCPNDCDKRPVDPCPKCGSESTGGFRDCDHGDMHCWACGAVWWRNL